MRSTLLPSFAVIAASLLFAAPAAKALSLVITTNAYSDSFGGGEFTINSATISNASYSSLTKGAGGEGFESFCMEYAEHFSPGGTYQYTQGNAAFGGDTLAGFDTVSVGTAWLYSQFATGTLAGYDFTGATRASSALQLQLAIWYLEDETTIPSFIADHGAYNPATNSFLNAAFAYFGSDALAHADNAVGGYGMYVLNLTSDNGATQNQSQTYYSKSVPDTGYTLAMVAAAVIGMVAISRRTRTSE